MTARCQGGCGKTVTEAGKWCPECFFAEPVGPSATHECGASRGALVCTLPKGHPDWHESREGIFVHGSWATKSDPPRPDPALNSANLQSLRFEIAAAGFKVGFGRESERAEALQKLIHLVHVLQHEQHLTKKET